MLKSFKPNAHNVKAIDFYHVLCLSLCCGAEADGKVNVKLSTYSHPHHSPFTMQSVFPFCTAARRKSAKTLIELLCTSNLLIKKAWYETQLLLNACSENQEQYKETDLCLKTV